MRLLYKQKRKVAEKIMLRTARILLSNHWKERRKNRMNHEDIIDLFVCKSNIYYYIQDIKKGVTQQLPPLKTKKFIDMTKETKSSPVSKRNGVKNELYLYDIIYQ